MLPESPRWLLLSGKGEQQASEALQRTLGTQAAGPLGQERVRLQMKAMAESLATSSEKQPGLGIEAEKVGSSSGSGSDRSASPMLILEPRFRRPLLIGTSLMLFQQVQT